LESAENPATKPPAEGRCFHKRSMTIATVVPPIRLKTDFCSMQDGEERCNQRRKKVDDTSMI
jgi:hypothetical protein